VRLGFSLQIRPENSKPKVGACHTDLPLAAVAASTRWIKSHVFIVGFPQGLRILVDAQLPKNCHY